METRNLNKNAFWITTFVYLIVILEIAMISEVLVHRHRYIYFDNDISSPNTEKWLPHNEIQPSPNIALPDKLGDKTVHHP
jgi:hypothetical protein